MKVIGLTGGIASGKTTILNYIKSLEIPTHDSDGFVSKLYKSPTKKFLEHLKTIGLNQAIEKRKINKTIIRERAFKDQSLLKKLEKFIHKEIEKSRNNFLETNRKKRNRLVVLDIPLLIENKLEKTCDHVILAYSPKKIRIRRALNRRGLNKKIIMKIFSSQTTDKKRLLKADFIIKTNNSKKKTYDQVLNVINNIKIYLVTE